MLLANAPAVQATACGNAVPVGERAINRIHGLDMLRALAVFLVLAHHAAYRFKPEQQDMFAQVFKYAGWIGVDVFFVISGYMITRVLLRDHHARDIRGFFVRRAFRIFPLLAVAVALFLAISVLTGREAEKLPLIWSPALLLNGWTIPFLGYEQVPFTITWSLSVEETAYALLGAASLMGLTGIRAMLVSFLLVSILVRVIVVATGALDLFDLYFFVPARLDGIALGGLAALGVFDRFTRYRSTLWLAALSTLGLIWLYQFTRLQSPFMPLVGYALFGLSCALWVACVAQVQGTQEPKPGRLMNSIAEALASFGKLSYFIYLFHIFVLEGIRLAIASGWFPSLTYWQALLVVSLVTYAAAAASWRYFESPLIEKGRSLTAPKPQEDPLSRTPAS